MTIFTRNLITLIAIFGALLSISNSSLAGIKEGGGGNAVLCYSDLTTRNKVASDLSKSISPLTPVNLKLDKLQSNFKPQLLDLWEARKSSGFPGGNYSVQIYEKSSDQIYKEIEPLLSSMGEMTHPYYQAAETVSAFLKRTRTISSQWKAEPNGIIKFEDSTFQAYFPNNCLVAQVAFYDDETNIIHFDPRVVDLMAKVDQYALRIHEDLYHASRVQGAILQEYINYSLNRVAASNGTEGADPTALARLRNLVNRSKNSDAVRVAVANIFTSSTYDAVTQETLKMALLHK